MTAIAATQWPPSDGDGRRIVLKCADRGACTLSSDPARRFPTAKAALDYAHRAYSAELTAIEVWQDDEYICCISHTAKSRRRPEVSGASDDRHTRWHRLREMTGARAKRAARFLLAPAGPSFWLALLLCSLLTGLATYIL